MHAVPHSDYKWIPLYQDHFSKFCVLQPEANRLEMLLSILLFHVATIAQNDDALKVWPMLSQNQITQVLDV